MNELDRTNWQGRFFSGLAGGVIPDPGVTRKAMPGFNPDNIGPENAHVLSFPMSIAQNASGYLYTNEPMATNLSKRQSTQGWFRNFFGGPGDGFGGTVLTRVVFNAGGFPISGYFLECAAEPGVMNFNITRINDFIQIANFAYTPASDDEVYGVRLLTDEVLPGVVHVVGQTYTQAAGQWATFGNIRDDSGLVTQQGLHGFGCVTGFTHAANAGGELLADDVTIGEERPGDYEQLPPAIVYPLTESFGSW